TYTYRAAGKTHVDDHATTDPDYQAAYGTVGVDVPLEVDSERPERSRIEGTRHSFFGYGGALTLFFPAVGVAVLLGAAYTWIKESRSAAGGGGTAPPASSHRARERRDDRRK
ncbi:MAG TPA: hypothetical protein VLC93_01540, partial [Myxococcota bacterium]|nr:hypothetical protein [Myxococcota bacterium]